MQASRHPEGPPPLTVRTFVLRRERAAAVPGLGRTAEVISPVLPLRSTKYFGSPLQVLNKLTADTILGPAYGGRLTEGDKSHRAQLLRGQLERTIRVTTKDVLDSVISVEDTLGDNAVSAFILPIVAPRLSSFEEQVAVKDIHSRLVRLSEVHGELLSCLYILSPFVGHGRVHHSD